MRILIDLTDKEIEYIAVLSEKMGHGTQRKPFIEYIIRKFIRENMVEEKK